MKIKDAADKNGDVDGTCKWGIALVIQMADFSRRNINDCLSPFKP